MHKKARAVAAVIATTLAAASLAACSSGSTDSGSADGGMKIGYMIWDTSVPFYSNLISNAEATADELGADLDIRSGNGDLSTQVSVVQDFVTAQVDMILISPSDPQGIVPAIRQANSAGIPVMAVNTMADTSTGAEVVTYVGVDDVEFGRHQAELLVEAVGENAKVGYVMGALGTSAQIQRKQGLEEGLADYPGIEIVAEQTANWDNAEALGVIQDMLSKYPSGQLDAIVSQGPESVSGAKNAAESGRTDVTFVLGDYPADVKKAIQDGFVFGTVDQDPAPQGKQAIQYAVDWLNGDEDAVPQPQAFIDMPVITSANVDDIAAAWGE